MNTTMVHRLLPLNRRPTLLHLPSTPIIVQIVAGMHPPSVPPIRSEFKDGHRFLLPTPLFSSRYVIHFEISSSMESVGVQNRAGLVLMSHVADVSMDPDGDRELQVIVKDSLFTGSKDFVGTLIF
ncbi:hypothetical protein L1887_20721 [Cichorium endivia]|nr:hypothetical protein L1887_20721 [Cichorium endivia]